jgi:hypothetical protein
VIATFIDSRVANPAVFPQVARGPARSPARLLGRSHRPGHPLVDGEPAVEPVEHPRSASATVTHRGALTHGLRRSMPRTSASLAA